MRIQKISGGSIKKFAITIKIIDNKKKTILMLTRKLLYTSMICSLEMSDIWSGVRLSGQRSAHNAMYF